MKARYRVEVATFSLETTRKNSVARMDCIILCDYS